MYLAYYELSAFGCTFLTFVSLVQEADAAASTTDADQADGPVATSAIAKDESAPAETDGAQQVVNSDQELSDDGASSS